MSSPPQPDLQPVSRADLDVSLRRISGNADPRTGLFGPDSITWRINRESALFLGAGRAALLQLAHPWVAAAIARHSTVLNRPIARFHNTFRVVYTMIYGSLDQAREAARSLHTLHTRIQGGLPRSVAGWPAGAHYEANEVASLRWVWSTLIETAVLAWQTVLPLSAEERERYYQEMKTFAALFGIPESALPPTWSAFEDYNREMAASSQLGVDAAARAMGQAILSGAGSWIKPPRWYRAITTEWLPPRFRQEFDLPFAAAEQRSAARARRWLPRVYPALPPSIRFVGPYREAQARLAGRHPGWLTRRSNRFWIGQPLLPFGDPPLTAKR